MTRKPLDCTECGLCCMAGLIVTLTKEDEARLGKRRVRLHVIQPRPIDMLAAIIDGAMAALSMPELSTRQLAVRSGPLRKQGRSSYSYEACVYLRGVPLKSTRCFVYDDRPSVCREFKPGSEGCRSVRGFFDVK
jgi:Fe-S-cluster containining protein